MTLNATSATISLTARKMWVAMNKTANTIILVRLAKTVLINMRKKKKIEKKRLKINL